MDGPSRHIARDPDVYADPEAFVPERYLDMDAANLEKNDPRKFVFGFGRRYACRARTKFQSPHIYVLSH